MKYNHQCSNILSTVALITVLSLTSCASFYAQQPGLVEQVDQWRAKSDFELALNTIAKLKPDHQNYEQLMSLIPTIERERSNYIKEVLAQAKQYSNTQDWVSATAAIEQGLVNLPSAPELIEQRRYYDEKRLERVERDKAAILIAQAKYIITARPHQESLLYNSNAKFFASNSYNNFNNAAKQASRELYVLGARYWHEQKTVQAREALTLSIQTAPNSLSEDLLAEVLDLEQNNRTAERHNSLKKADDQWPELVQSYNDRIKYEDFLGAERILKEMKVLGFSDSKAYQQRFDQLKQERVKLLTIRGNKLYNAGLLEEAIESWQQAQKLEPTNLTITQNIERARTFLDNLERWSDE